MSDIQPTEAEREEAKRFLNRLSHIYEEPEDIDVGPEDEMVDAIIEYRADAVKAERERLAKVIKSDIEQRRIEYEEKHRGMWHSFEYSEGLLNASDIAAKAILSDDQEARRG